MRSLRGITSDPLTSLDDIALIMDMLLQTKLFDGILETMPVLAFASDWLREASLFVGTIKETLSNFPSYVYQ